MLWKPAFFTCLFVYSCRRLRPLAPRGEPRCGSGEELLQMPQQPENIAISQYQIPQTYLPAMLAIGKPRMVSLPIDTSATRACSAPCKKCQQSLVGPKASFVVCSWFMRTTCTSECFGLTGRILTFFGTCRQETAQGRIAGAF